MSAESQPIQLSDFVAALGDLSNENLVSIQKQLRLSLEKLHETNDYLNDVIKSTVDPVDLKMYADTIKENTLVIASQHLRLEAISVELSNRGNSEEKDEGVYL